ncbi:MAG: hypothetical protein KGJ43_03880, partial [Acidobacteriota bacterium]|nr:hypothetical protein [Acidobacteriota bacterium]
KRADGTVQTEATIKIWVPDAERARASRGAGRRAGTGEGAERRYVHTAEGNGPVNALDNALRGAIGAVHPHLREIELVNYKVRILDEAKGTGAITRVLIDASDGRRVWGSIGVSENLISASWDALVDSLEYGMVASSARAAKNGRASSPAGTPAKRVGASRHGASRAAAPRRKARTR